MTFPTLPSRRLILKGGVSFAGLAVLMATGGCEAILDAIRSRPVRKRAGSSAATGDMAVYADAVTQMKNLPANDPRNWTAQAQIHQSFCPHGNWYFLPWHRAYLYFFERICRELTGEPGFALPYWNWQVNRSIPSGFWSGSLDDNTRSINSGSQAGLSYIGSGVIQGILDLTNFEQFASYEASALRGGSGGGYGSLEGTPHNSIHGFVGGNMGGFMSPLDPVFWAHHNMIDCLWDKWNNQLGNLNTSASNWTGFNLTGMFVDGDGSPAEMSCGVTTILPLISYRYAASTKGDGFLIGTSAFSREVLEAGGNIRHSVRDKVRLGGQAVLGPNERIMRKIGAQARPDRASDERVLLQLSGVRAPTDDNGFVRVFVNLPGASAGTPIDDPHYAGSIGFFTDPRMKMKMPDTYYVDISDTLDRLQAGGMLAASDGVSVTLVHVPHDAETRQLGQFRMRSLDLVTTPSAVKGQ